MQCLLTNQSVDYALTVRQELLQPTGPNFLRVVDMGTPVFHLVKMMDYKPVISLLAIMLTKFVSSFNVSKNMTTSQITDYALTLVMESPELGDGIPAMRLEDFAVFFEQAKTGRWGKPFDYVDAALIESWLDKYWDERLDGYRNAKAMQPVTADSQKQIAARVYTPEEVEEITSPLIEELKAINRMKATPAEKSEEQRRRVNILRRARMLWQNMDPDKQASFNLSDEELNAMTEETLEDQVNKFAAAMVAGTITNTDENLQFYANNAEAVELTIKSIQLHIRKRRKKN